MLNGLFMSIPTAYNRPIAKEAVVFVEARRPCRSTARQVALLLLALVVCASGASRTPAQSRYDEVEVTAEQVALSSVAAAAGTAE